MRERLAVATFRYRVLVITALLALAAWLVPVPLTLAAPQERHLQLDARTFAFEPAVIRVNRGDQVVLTLQSLDVVHGFYLDGYGVQTEVEPGRSTQVRFVADQAGKFRFRCSVSCGSLHPFMIGELVVEPNLTFWRALAVVLIAVAGASVFILRSQSSAASSPAR